METPRLYRYYSYPQPIYIPAPTGGINTDAHPWELPDTQAPQLDNFLIQPGKVVLRNPVASFGPTLQTAGQHTTWAQTYISPVGAVIIDHASGGGSYMLVFGRANSNTAVVDPWNAPLLNAQAAQLAQGLIRTAPRMNIITGVALNSAGFGTRDQVVGPRVINFDGLYYAISYDAAAAAVTDTNNTYAIPPLNLLAFAVAPPAAGGYGPTVYTNAPHGAFDLIGYQSRIWLLGGVDTPGGLTVHEPTTLYFTNPGVSGVGFASADWKDPVDGTSNKLRMDNNNDDFGVGLAVARNNIVVFRRSSVWSLRGSDPSNYSLTPITREVGCMDARSIVETDQGAYFMSHRGLMFTNGSGVTNVSGSVSRNLAAAIQQEQTALRTYGGWISCGVTSQGQIMVSIGKQDWDGTNLVMLPLWAGMFDPALNVWTRHTSAVWGRENSESQGGNGGLPPLFLSRRARNQLYTIGDTQITELENFARSSPLFGKGNVSFLVRQSIDNSFADYTLNTTADAIPGKWVTRILPVRVSDRKNSFVMRYYMDHVTGFCTLCGTAPTPQGWQTTPFDPTGASLDTPQVWPVASVTVNQQGDLVGRPLISHQNRDWFHELTDVYFEVDWINTVANGTYLAGSLAEIYGIGMEFQNTTALR